MDASSYALIGQQQYINMACHTSSRTYPIEPEPDATLLTAVYIRTKRYRFDPGNIPCQLGKLRWLESVDVSGNQLQGENLKDVRLDHLDALCDVDPSYFVRGNSNPDAVD